MNTRTFIICAVVAIALVGGLAVALAWSRLDLGVVRDDLADRDVTVKRLRAERNEIRTAMHQQRMNTYTLLGRIKQLEGDDESVALTTPLPSQILAADVVAQAEAILRQVGGQS